MDKRPNEMTDVLTVHLEESGQIIQVPLRRDTRAAQVLDYCTQPGDTQCHLVEVWKDCERILQPTERIHDLLNHWGAQRGQVCFYLRHGHMDEVNSRTNILPEHRNGTLENSEPPSRMPSRVDLTLSELQEMAARQQQQIEQQQQMLVAKEQRVKFLKQQEQRHLQIAGENDRLRKLRERVEAQETKLRKLRAMRGEATGQANSNTTLAGELEAIKSLFHEKEKELATAVGKVDELSKQLDTLRTEKSTNGSSAPTQNAQALVELEKLRKELVMRNKLNEQQNSKLAGHCEVLQQRKDEMIRLDNKIAELQSRIKKKPQGSNTVKDKNEPRGRVMSSNVAAIEPYMKHAPKGPEDDTNKGQTITKQDPKYQTLPHSLKFKEKNKGLSVEGDTSQVDVVDGKAGKDQDVKPRPGSAQGLPSKTLPPSYVSVMGLAAQQGAQSNYGSGKSMPAPPNTSADVPITFSDSQPSTRVSSLMTNFAPRPYGSTYSSSVLGTRPSSVILPDSSILETPNTSVLSPKTSTPVGKDTEGRSGPATSMSDMYPPASSVQNTYGSLLPVKGVTSGSVGNVPPTSSHLMPQSLTTTAQDHNLSSSSHSSSADGSATTSSTTSSALKTPMYASKSVIANTYMRKLGPNALEKYRNSMSQIYQGFTPGQVGGDSMKMEQSDSHQSGTTAMVAPLNIHSDRLTDSRNPLSPRNRFNVNTDKVEAEPLPYSRDLPPYNIDPVKFRPNAPRPHRRRSSSGGESPHADDKIHARVPTPVTLPTDDVFTDKDDVDSSQVVNKPPDLIQNNSSSRGGSGYNEPSSPSSRQPKERSERLPLVLRRKGNLKSKDYKSSRRVSFDPLALLLDASLEGELDLVKKTAQEVPDPSCPNDEGITALHNAICAGHFEIVKFLVEFGCNVNAPDSDGWTPLHCAASCNNLPMVKVLVEHGACIFATTISDQETAAEKCEEDEDGYDGCSEYLYNIQEKLGILNKGVVYAVFDYAAQNNDELSFTTQDKLVILRKGDETEQEWWWAKRENKEGYIPRNLLGLYARVKPKWVRD